MFTILVILSWILIHLLTLFGVFLAIAYPIWWIIAPKQTICIFCRSRKEGQTCPSCHQLVHKAEGFAPKTFLSAVYNGLILLFFSILSIAIVFVEGQLLFRFGFPVPTKTLSFSIATQQTHQIGDVFPLQVKINGIKDAINAVRVDFSYNPDLLQVTDISTKDSFANIFIEKQIDNKAGIASLAGGLSNPGYSGTNGTFATVYLRGVKQGVATVNFLPSSSVLANNGHGDNLLNSFGNTSYLIVAKPENTAQKNKNGVSVESNVLGTSTKSTKTQMIFYNDKQVLGANTSIANETQSVPQDTVYAPLNKLGELDKFILTVWKLF